MVTKMKLVEEQNPIYFGLLGHPQEYIKTEDIYTIYIECFPLKFHFYNQSPLVH
jgi:hypothetical protein